MEYLIRKAEKNDAESVARVHVDTWQSHYRGQISDEYLDNISIQERKDMWDKDFSNPEEKSETFVAEIGNKIIGFCSVGPSRDKDAEEKTGELYAIYLDPSIQKKGIGSALMDTGLNFLKEEGFLMATLWVLRSNKSTIGFYESKGWYFDGAEMKTEKKGISFDEIRYSKKL